MGTVGSIIYIIGLLIAAVGGVWILALAFQDSFAWAVGIILVPFVSLIYVFTHIRETWVPFLLQIIGTIIFIIGQGILFYYDVSRKIEYRAGKNPPPGFMARQPQPQQKKKMAKLSYYDEVNIKGKNVVRNGKFSKKFKSWDKNKNGKGDITIKTKKEGKSRVLYIKRTDSNNDSSYSGVTQKLNIKLSDVSQLVIKADLKPVMQTMSGTGNDGDYPIGIRLKIEDENKGSGTWFLGLYTKGSNNCPYIFKVPAGEWVKIQKDLTDFFPSTATIKYIQVIGSGWDFCGCADNVGLYVQKR